MATRKAVTWLFVAFAAWYWQKYIIRGPVFEDMKDFTGKTVLITGGNAGIGKASAIEFAKQGARVVIASRNVDKSERAKLEITEESGNSNIAVYKLDLEDFESVRAFCREFDEKEEHIDVLVNNAGVLGIRGVTADGFNRMSVINYFGPFLLTNLLTEKMKKQSKTRPVRIISVSSDAYIFYSELVFEKFRQDSSNIIDDFALYGHTNLATFLFARKLDKLLKGYDISTFVVHPGTIRSELGGGLPAFRLLEIAFLPFTRSTYYGAQTILYCAMEDSLADFSGEYFADCNRQELALNAKNETAADMLWEKSLKVTNYL